MSNYLNNYFIFIKMSNYLNNIKMMKKKKTYYFILRKKIYFNFYIFLNKNFDLKNK